MDVWEFDRLTASDQDDHLQIAIDVYTGDMQLDLNDGWLITERELRRNQYSSLWKSWLMLKKAGKNSSRLC